MSMYTWMVSRLQAISHSWRESLQPFLPPAFKQFLLITLKSVLLTYQALLKGAWPYIGALLLGMLINELVYTKSIADTNHMKLELATTIHELVHLVLAALIVFITCCACRPSVDQKNIHYFFDFFKKYAFYSIAYSAIVRFLAAQNLGVQRNRYVEYQPVLIPIITTMPWALLSSSYVANALVLFLSPFFVFALLFMLDSGSKVGAFWQSLVRALKMIVYNYPFCVISYSVTLFIAFLVYRVVGMPLLVGFLGKKVLTVIGYTVCYGIIVPVFVCWLTNFYCKRVHEQFQLYYDIS